MERSHGRETFRVKLLSMESRQALSQRARRLAVEKQISRFETVGVERAKCLEVEKSRLVFPHRASSATTTASAAGRCRWRSELIALGLQFRRVDPPLVRFQHGIAMHTASRLGITLERNVRQYLAIA